MTSSGKPPSQKKTYSLDKLYAVPKKPTDNIALIDVCDRDMENMSTGGERLNSRKRDAILWHQKEFTIDG